jgi:acyl carrier protein phosphodiesterase
MNYLAHIFLSGNQQSVQIGSFIADFVKGKQLYTYPTEIQQGIILHRKIDTFTDEHPLVCELNSLLKPSFGRYSPIILDMYFDYLLAKSFHHYSPNKSLLLFSWQFYGYLIRHYSLLPIRVKRFVFHFMITNRLYQYKSIQGLYNSLHIMSVYKTDAINPSHSIEFLQEHEELLEKQFQQFFTDILQFTAAERLKTE